MKTNVKEVYEAPMTEVLEVRMETGLLQVSRQRVQAGRQEYESEEW